MVARVGFWTPIKYKEFPDKQGEWPASFVQKVRECADCYFAIFDVRVAVITRAVIENGGFVESLQSVQGVDWQTTIAKTARLITLASSLLLSSRRSFLYPYQRTVQIAARCIFFTLPVLALIIKIVSRSRYPSFYIPEPTPSDSFKILMSCRNFGHTYSTQHVEKQKPSPAFVKIKIDGKSLVIPIALTQSRQDVSHYTYYKGLPSEILCEIAKDAWVFEIPNNCEGLSPLRYILQNSSDPRLNACSFLTYLTTTKPEQPPPLHTVSAKSLLEIIDLAKENNVRIDLQSVNQNTGKSLCSRWIGTGNLKMTQKFLELDPSIIQSNAVLQRSFFQIAALNGHTEEALFLWAKMFNADVQANLFDKMVYGVLIDEAGLFTNTVMDRLLAQQKDTLFSLANIHISKKVLIALRQAETYTAPAEPERAALFSSNMDAIEVEQVLQKFLCDLRCQHLLLTTKEMQFLQKNRPEYFYKRRDIGRILGRDYVERKARELKLSYIKVPKKIAVIDPDAEAASSLTFILSTNGNMDLGCDKLHIYAEPITPIDRKATQQEMLGLLTLILDTGFNDCTNSNLFMGKNQEGEEGIYFIDTEYTNFCNNPALQIQTHELVHLMEEKDHVWLSQKIKDCFTNVPQADPTAQKQGQLAKYGFLLRKKPFTIPLSAVCPA